MFSVRLLNKAFWKRKQHLIEAMLCDWMSHFFFTRISLYDGAAKSTVFWKRRMLSKSNICVKATFLANVCGSIFLPWLCFVMSKTYLCEFCFVENMFALIRVRKAHKSYLQSNLFYKYFTLLILNLWKANKKKELTISDGRTSSDGSNIIWLIVAIFLLWIFS